LDEFVDGAKETFEGDGFQEVVGHVEFVAFQCVFGVGGGEDDEGLFLEDL